MLLLFALGPALAAGNDNLEIGGPWGTPTDSGGTAAWWNPAALVDEPGLRLEIEAAPAWGYIHYTRPGVGEATWRGAGVAPFVGVAKTPEKGPSWGAALLVPYAAGGKEEERGFASYHLRTASMVSVYGVFALAIPLGERLSLGGSVAGVYSRFSSTVDMDTVPSLHQALTEMGEDSPYTDADLFNPAYAATVRLQGLTDFGVTGGLGLLFRPLDTLAIGVSGVAPLAVNTKGDLQMDFGCPPAEDSLGRFGAESRGICHRKIQAHGAASYTLPGRVSAAMRITPDEHWTLTVMGGWVGWSVQEQMLISISDAGKLNRNLPEETALMINREQPRARDLNDSTWGGLDLKVQANERWLLGARAVVDLAAVPDAVLTPSNFDTNTLQLTGLVALQTEGPLSLGLSFTETFQQPRTTDHSEFGVSLDPSLQNDAPYQYPDGIGSYDGARHRLGLTLRLRTL